MREEKFCCIKPRYSEVRVIARRVIARYDCIVNTIRKIRRNRDGNLDPFSSLTIRGTPSSSLTELTFTKIFYRNNLNHETKFATTKLTHYDQLHWVVCTNKGFSFLRDSLNFKGKAEAAMETLRL